MIKPLRIPGTFEIALILTLIVIFIAWIGTIPEDSSMLSYGFNVLGFWKKGFWELLEFTMQMVLILILGHALALTKPVDRLLNTLIQKVRSNTSAVLTTGLTAMAAGYFNWGFGLILGAILAVKIANHCKQQSIAINYPLIAASAYLGMMVWHGGFSGSATLKVAEEGHFLAPTIGVLPISKTVFSSFNLWTNALLLLVMTVVLFVLSKKKSSVSKSFEVPVSQIPLNSFSDKKGLFVGLVMLLLAMADFFTSGKKGLSFIDLNYINFLLFALGLVFYQSIKGFVAGVTVAVKGAVDIIIQFPLYAGILGVLKYSGLLEQLSLGLIQLGG